MIMAVFIGVALLVTGLLVIKVMILLLLPSSLLSSSSVVVKVKDSTVSQGDNGKVIGVDGDDDDDDDVNFLSILFGNVDVIDE